MPNWLLRPEGLVEPVPAPEFCIDGIGAIEVRNGMVRVFYFVERGNIHGDDCVKQVEVIIRRPVNSVRGSLAESLNIWRNGNAVGFKPVLIK